MYVADTNFRDGISDFNLETVIAFSLSYYANTFNQKTNLLA